MEKTPTKFHALQLFTDTFIAETVHLTNEQIGIYIRLINFAWTKNTKPFTTESAYRICQCKSKECEEKVFNILLEFFIGGDKKDLSKWTHNRLVKEHKFLTDKYNKQSKAGKKGMESRYNGVNNKTITPIPIPNPIPNNNIYEQSFEQLWKSLIIKKGSKNKAWKVWQKCHTEISDVEKTAEIYNKQQNGKDAQFVPHFATWLFQKRWEINEDDETFNELPTIIQKMEKLGYKHQGKEEHFELFNKDNKKYKIDKYDKEHIIQEI